MSEIFIKCLKHLSNVSDIRNIYQIFPISHFILIFKLVLNVALDINFNNFDRLKPILPVHILIFRVFDRNQ